MQETSTTVDQENQRRYNLRKIILSVGVPLIVTVMIFVVAAILTIVTTWSAERAYSYDMQSMEQKEKVISLVNHSASTATILEGYKAKYNYATAIASDYPMNAVNIYATEVIPYSPPQFICYPALNGLYYAELHGDLQAKAGNSLEAEYYYNYATYFLNAAGSAGCSSSSSGGDGESESSSGSGEGEPQPGQLDEEGQEQLQQKKDNIENKRDEARKQQGKEVKEGADKNSDTPSEKQKKESQDGTQDSEQRQKDTEPLRDADGDSSGKSGESATPW